VSNPEIIKNITPPVGYPIIVLFRTYQMQKLISATLKNRNGEEVEIDIISPDKNTNKDININGIIIIPKKPLLNNERYQVDISCNVSTSEEKSIAKNFSYGFNTAEK